ncbi:MAG: hypothetical protein IPP49_05690 [Saprospiraceae bacterium]|nr:hypothetical protein [Saprospiraceae bacterium]
MPLTLSKLSDSTTYNIYGQSVKAKFKAGVNGDISHFKKEGAVHITSAEPLEKFLLCYSNGSEDDGMSNSHAIKIPQFEFAELLGRIEGKVYEYGTQQTLSGAVVRLVDTSGELVINKEGIVMQSMTDESGFILFPSYHGGSTELFKSILPDMIALMMPTMATIIRLMFSLM